MRRRHFIQGSAIGAISLGSAGLLWLKSTDQFNKTVPIDDALNQVLESLNTPPALREALADHYQDIEQISAEIQRLLPATPSLSPEQLVAHLQKLIADDFKQGRICTVDGWILSHSECLLIALAPDTAGEHQAAPASLADATPKRFLAIKNWGPQSTPFAIPFLEQSDGHSGMWFQVDGFIPRSLQVYINDEQVSVTVNPNLFTLALYDPLREELIQTPGEHAIYAYDPVKHLRQRIGLFTVGKAPEGGAKLARGGRSKLFCPPQAYGPRQAVPGEGFNIQPDGRSALWIRIDCAPRGTLVRLADTVLRTQVHAELITASLPSDHPLLGTPGRHPLELHDEASGETVVVGYFEILQP